jgi:hypothetical protein
MRKLWTFGCSFTHGDGTHVRDRYYQKFRKNDDDLPWNQLLSNKLNLQLENKGLPGISNDTIIDTVINNWDFINEDDIVIIGKTWSHRFDFPKKIGSIEPQSIVFRGGESDVKKWFDDLTVGIFNDTQIECIKVFSVEFATEPLYSHRHDVRLNFIKDRLINDKKVKVCYIWDVEHLWKNFNIIVDATNGEIVDHHWSYQGHKEFLSYLETQIDKPSKLI